ncbi:head-tail connector [Paracoccus phage vB_PthS_Pthi1]|uniref:Phage gp6-like head-tail connector protein n=1 Tax=Paracoccus thiocyanatus TaxID=34006 RepID=A0A1N6SFG6_9RHOB|nr:head-tail connector protein [Paracoccus thiocyanatus]AZV00396.1 head-tail connector [Paracoccus phage vB_PthS_Pthi1]SIQ39838.1 Phage gp6-like head-tail connector protein [Paracoccus thiocyanatus]
MIVPLADLKVHLRVDHDAEDWLITNIGLAAELRVRNWIGRPIYAAAEDLPPATDPRYNRYQMVAGEAIIVAIMQLADRMYQQRSGEGDSQGDAVPPRTVRDLLSGYRVFFPAPEAGEGW